MASCVIVGCIDKYSKRHRFPNPAKERKRFEIWLDILKNPALKMEDCCKIYNNRKICHVHFLPSDFQANQVLRKTAVPSLYLNGTPILPRAFNRGMFSKIVKQFCLNYRFFTIVYSTM